MAESTTDAETVRISHASDVVLAGRRTREKLADDEGADSVVEEVVLAVHELASNIVKHADEGSITLIPRSNDGRSGVELRAEDAGPGIADVERAVTDGYSTVGSLGSGLGTVHRLMDDVEIHADGDQGVRIVATRWFDRTAPRTTDPPVAVGVATRSKPGCEYNGDTFVVDHGRSRSLVGVVDGLGHGQHANRAAVRARQYLQSHADRSLPRLFEETDRECRSSRGVVLALARFDWDEETVTVGGVGNVAVEHCADRETPTIVTPRGVVGANAPTPSVTERDWEPDDVLVMHSDGIAPEWGCDSVPDRGETSVTRAARNLLHSHAREDDDATVLLARGTDP